MVRIRPPPPIEKVLEPLRFLDFFFFISGVLGELRLQTVLLPIQIAASRLLREVPQAPLERMIASCGCAFSTAYGVNATLILDHSDTEKVYH